MATRTTIGSTIRIEGELRSQEDVSILGNITGEIVTTADLFVENGGTIDAEVQTRNIDIRGKVVGNVEASDRFQIHDGGEVTGDVRAPRIVLGDGAKYKGNMDMADTRRNVPAVEPTTRKR